MDQPFHPLFNFHERPIVRQTDHAPFHLSLDRVAFLCPRPGVGDQLLQAERDAFVLPIEAQHHDLDLVAHLEQLRGMSNAPPTHVRDVQQTVDPAEVDKHAVVGDVLDDAFDHLVVFEIGEGLVLEMFAFLLEDGAAGEHYITALFVVF